MMRQTAIDKYIQLYVNTLLKRIQIKLRQYQLRWGASIKAKDLFHAEMASYD